MISDIYVALLLAKIAAICVFLLCKIFGPKIWSCKTFDKFQVWSNTSHNQYVWDASKKNLMLYFLGVAYSGNSYFGFFGSPGVRCEKAIVWVWSSFYWRWTNWGQTCACLSGVGALRLKMMFWILRSRMIFWTLIWILKMGWCFDFEVEGHD